ncbi:MAG: hypothetical protein WDN00_18080 [Limisphaerales bacterium]
MLVLFQKDMMKPDQFPVVVSEEGVSAKIRESSQKKNGKSYTVFIAEYFQSGKRKQVWRSKFEDAKIAALEACRQISRGQQDSLTLTNMDRMAYLRASEALSPVCVKLDVAAHEYASAVTLLGGRATINEACRDWVKRHAVAVTTISIAAAIEELKSRDKDNVDGSRMHQMTVLLGRFANDFNVNVPDVQGVTVDEWLSNLQKLKGGKMSEKSKRNYRDMIGYFNRFCVSRGYLAKGTDWLEHARKYSSAKHGSIEIFTPDEFKKILAVADKRLAPFLAINGFAGIRNEEIARLDWEDIALEDGESFISIYADTAKTKVGRMVPVKDNLKSWLLPFQKKTGAVCEFANIWMQLPKVAEKAGLKWKKNGLRHSYISYRKSECADIARVADEAGNSVSVIRGNYLKVIRPAVAAEWFGIMPPRKSKARRLAI